MADDQTLEISLVSSDLATKLRARAFAQLRRQVPQNLLHRTETLADALVMNMHNRHVGITPHLAVEFARWTIGGNAAPFPWSAVEKRLLAELSLKGKAANVRSSLLIDRYPLYVAQRIAVPLVTQACINLKQSFLFTQDNVDQNITEAEYETYAKDLTKQFLELTEGGKQEWDLFWRERALTLGTFSGHESDPTVSVQVLLRGDGREAPSSGRRARRNTTEILPEADPLQLSFFFQDDMEVNPRESSRVVKQLVSLVQKHTTRRIREGGIRGIRFTRRQEDLDMILLSEFLNPPELLADRLLNTGYLAREREPKRERYRDFLLVAFMPASVRETASAGLIKFAWYQTVLGLSILLRRSKLNASHFVWIEGDSLGRMRHAEFSLNQLASIPSFADRVSNPSFTHEFLTLLQWMPEFLNGRGTFSPVFSDQELQHMPGRVAAERLYQARAWASRVARRPLPGHPVRLKQIADQFGFVHYMLFLPTAQRSEETIGHQDSLLGKFSAELELGFSAGRNMSITWVPNNLRDRQAWDYWAKRIRSKEWKSELQAQETPGETQSEIAEYLITEWLQEFVREIWSE